MKHSTLSAVTLTLLLLSGFWVVQALGQVTSTPSSGIGDKIKTSEKARVPIKVDGIPAQFDLETRVQVLERQVAQLQSQVNQLTARVSELDVTIVRPAGSEPGYSGPRLALPVDKKDN